MIFIVREAPFVCEHCGAPVAALTKGTYRNHCPKCLWSKHVDAEGPGDRTSVCLGMMEPVEIDQRSGKGWMIIHLCEKCGKRIPNKAAPDDELQEFMRRKSA